MRIASLAIIVPVLACASGEKVSLGGRSDASAEAGNKPKPTKVVPLSGDAHAVGSSGSKRK